MRIMNKDEDNDNETMNTTNITTTSSSSHSTQLLNTDIEHTWWEHMSAKNALLAVSKRSMSNVSISSIFSITCTHTKHRHVWHYNTTTALLCASYVRKITIVYKIINFRISNKNSSHPVTAQVLVALEPRLPPNANFFSDGKKPIENMAFTIKWIATKNISSFSKDKVK